MPLFSRFFYRRPPDGLLEFWDRVYVFDSCFSTEVLSDEIYQIYLQEIVSSLYEEYPDSSFLAFNFREGEKRSHFAEVLSEYDVTIIDYPRQYEGCPLLPLSLMQHLFCASESWLSLGNHQNIILFHCERGGWPLLAFLLAGIMVYQKFHTGERSLEMVYREVPKGLLQLLSPLNPFPSQLRYLQYVARRNISSEWPPMERSLSLDCLILRAIPSFDSNKGCRPVVRIFGRNFKNVDGLSTKMLYSMSQKKRSFRHYKQADCDVIKIDIQCLVQGDTVLECVHQDLDSEREVMMFRVMFNTAFIRSNILILNRDDLDILWDSRDRFPRSFRAEVLFGDTESISPLRAPTATLNGEEKGGLPIEAFSRVQELFGGVDWLDNSDTAALWFLKQVSASSLQEKIEKLILTDAKELNRNQNSVYEQQSVTSSIDTDEENYESDAVTTEASLDDAKVHDGVDFDSQSENSYHAFQDYHMRHIDDFSDGTPTPGSEISLLNDNRSNNLLPNLSPISSASTEGEVTLVSSPSVESASDNDLSLRVPHDQLLLPPSNPSPPTHSVNSSFAAASSLDKLASDDSNPSSLSSSQSKPLPADSFESDLLFHTPLPPPPPPPLPSSTKNKGMLWLQSSVSAPPPPPPPPRPPLFHVTSTQRCLAPPPPPPPPPPPQPCSILDKGLLVASPPSPQAVTTNECLPSPSLHPPLHPMSFNSLPETLTSQIPFKPNNGHAPLTSVASSLPPPPPLPPHLSSSNGKCHVPSFALSPPPPPPPPPPLPSIVPSKGDANSSLPHQITQKSASMKHVNIVSSSHPLPSAPNEAHTNFLSPPPPPPLPSNSRMPSISTSGISSSSCPPPPPPPPPPLPLPMYGNARPPPLMSNTYTVSPPSLSPSSVDSSNNHQDNAPKAPPPPPPPPSSTGFGKQRRDNAPKAPPPPPPPPLSSSNHGASIPAPPPPGPLYRCPAPPLPPPRTPKTPESVSDPPLSNATIQGTSEGLTLSTGPKVPNTPALPPPLAGREKSLVSCSGRGRGGLAANGAPKKASLKPLHWVKVTKAMKGSLWADTQKQESLSRAPEIDISELESLFSTAATSDGSSLTLDKSGSRRGCNVNKPEIVHLVDMNRSKNCEIMLTKIKMPLQDMLSAILALDTSVLDIDQVENLIKFCPTKEEMVMLKNHTGNVEQLGKCEQFFLEMMKVPRVESKLRVFAFRISFATQVNELRANLNIINDTSREVKDSVKLRQIMQTILTLGNALNQGTARGSAVGFRLDSLLKLSDTRARNNKLTLMHYLCKLLNEKMPELLDFDKDLVHLEAASKIQLKMVAEEMQAVSKGLEKVEQELAASENDGSISMGFRKALKEFLYTAEADVRSLISLYSEVGRNADSLAQYFGEDPARCPFEQVTSILVVFVNMFNKSREENARHVEAEKKKLEKESSMKERSKSFRRDGSRH